MRWQTLDSEYLVERPWLTARRDKVRLPNGRVFNEYYVLEYPEWVNVVAITKEGKMILERQYRHARGVVSTEIVAGVVEPAESPLHGAKRELREETGYTGGTWSKLMTIAPNPSTMSNLCHCFLAEGVEPTETQHWDDTEDLDVMIVDQQDVLDMLRQGRFIQALMVAPLWKYFAEHTTLLR